MFWIAGGLILLAALPALLNIQVAPLELFANLRPQVIVLAIAFGCAALTVGRYWPAGAAALVAAVLLATAPELFSSRPPAVERPALTVVWCNVFKTHAVVERIAELAEAQNADIVILGEPPRLAEQTRKALSGYAYVYGSADPDDHGALVFSRRALSVRAGPAPAPGGYPITIVDTDEMQIIAMHPPVAVSGRRLQASETMMSTALEEAASGATLIVGDMNATPWSARIRKMQATLVRLTPALGSTWFSSLPVLGLPIDHAFVTPDLRASARVGPGVGSDHLPLIISIDRAEGH